ncbi:hypothetical protein OZX74_03785 [Bifidobacterium sp. ESL0798]|uniref:hypothetical protein n=1 Tax=Bifidobacterium sp. ESL0798 TaxID=2983235 RepID=UPI0023F79665|nr:hypothetical protein [Bifidobacterium sp. ESL0798]WEV74648.1 hypothetical protein OZX74_03785 [Bifidobacterium sp. ESL0798]
MPDILRKPTPIAKIYEALSAVADGRVELCGHESKGIVTSSARTKRYTVMISDKLYTSNDNATYWQHYAGYPIIAVLIEQGRISLPPGSRPLLEHFRNINWKRLNTENRNHYDKAVSQFLSSTGHAEGIKKLVQNVYDQANSLPVAVKGNRKPIIKLPEEGQ